MTAFNLMETNDNLNTRLLYEPLEGVERLDNYQQGGYHPVQIGDHFHGRYRVIPWDMAPIQLPGWPLMNNPINTLH
jgi:hypothetical protein